MGNVSMRAGLILALTALQALGCGGDSKKAKTMKGALTTDDVSKDDTEKPVTVKIVSAPSSALDQGASFQFVALVEGTEELDVVWSASEGTIDARGLFVAPASAGKVIVTVKSASNPEGSASETVQINDVTVSAAGPTSLYSTGTANFSSEVDGTFLEQGVTWSVVGDGDVGSVDSTGMYTPNLARGDYTVTIVATSIADPTKKASVTVFVTASKITITPAAPTVFAGESAQFSIQAVGVGDGVTWEIVSADGGAISGEGLYTAPPTLGTYTVRAVSTEVPSISSTAAVSVALRPVISIQASSLNLLTGGTASFSAGVTNGSPQVIWSVLEGAAGGTIDAAGNYQAPGAGGVYHVVAASAEFPSVTASIAVAVCTAFDQLLTYANPGTAVTDATDDVITSRVRLTFAAAATMFTSFDTFDAAWLSLVADPLANSRSYTGPGTDGQWFTSDDAVGAYYTVRASGGYESGYARIGTAGTDGAFGTADDEVLEWVSYARDGAGRVTESTRAVTAGTDGTWGTADDGVGSVEAFTYDASGHLVQINRLSPAGQTTGYSVFENDTFGRPVTVTVYVNPGIGNVWGDGNDRYNRKWVYSYDDQGRPSVIVENVFAGPSNMAQPQNDRRVTYTYPGDGRIPVAMAQFSAGADKAIGNDDDVLLVFAAASNVCPW